jgi:alkylation response protein AidB-like acyl-CoA dehydrogenase
MESAIAKLFVSESYVENCMEALQIHGAYGYSTEMDFERNLRDSIAGKIYSGTSEIQKNNCNSNPRNKEADYVYQNIQNVFYH